MRFMRLLAVVGGFVGCAFAQAGAGIDLPSSQMLLPGTPGGPQLSNSFPTAVALSPDGRFAALLNNGRGTYASQFSQSIALEDLRTGQLSDFPDPRLKVNAHQTYFLGLAFSGDGRHLYASMASLTDPTGRRPNDTGNGIAVYSLEDGRLTAERFIAIAPQPLGVGRRRDAVHHAAPAGMLVPYPAGLAVVAHAGGERLLVADNLSDDALLLDAATGRQLQRFDLGGGSATPASYPYTVVASPDGRRAWCSLWNASAVAELDLETGRVLRRIPLLPPAAATGASSHPTALLLNADASRLYVALANRDRVAEVDTRRGAVTRMLSTELAGEKQGGTYPNALALSGDGRDLFVADAGANAVAVLRLDSGQTRGFVPTEWYPTALARAGDRLLIATGKSEGTGPNGGPNAPRQGVDQRLGYPYIASLIRGSLASVDLAQLSPHLAAWTQQVLAANHMASQGGAFTFAGGRNPIRHVIYIIKENRTYDQILGDLKVGDRPVGNGDPDLVLFGAAITPNEHALARQFGVIDDFYDSGEVSGDGHVWSTAAITSDYTEKTWQIDYRGAERDYDYEGIVSKALPLAQGLPDVNEPATGYLWGNIARHGLSYRHYGEFVSTRWCNAHAGMASPREGTPTDEGKPCARTFIAPGQPLPANVGEPHGSASPWPWNIPIIAEDVATKPELRGHFDPHYADFRLDYPDQLRTDEFLNEFTGFVAARRSGRGARMPRFVMLRLPNDHTAGTQVGMPTPAASVADNDLAVGRVVEAVSHSPYWDDTAIFIVEDDAQGGADHVDAHRSIALVISKYAPGTAQQPFVDSHFYTTVSMVHTMESLLGLPPMNNFDAHAPLMAPLLAGPGTQPPYTAITQNRDNGLIYTANTKKAVDADKSARLDFSHADAADSSTLNAILWHAQRGATPVPRRDGGR